MEWAEIPFEVMVSEADESFPGGLTIEETAVLIARNKAYSVKERLEDSNRIILAADTIVVLGDKVIGKPADRTEAIEILSSLSGMQHQVITGVVILKEKCEVSFSDVTNVIFHTLTNDQIEFYVDKYKPYDKAGAYAIQEWIGVVGIQSVSGDFYNVMGLPVSRVLRELEKFQNKSLQ